MSYKVTPQAQKQSYPLASMKHFVGEFSIDNARRRFCCILANINAFFCNTCSLISNLHFQHFEDLLNQVDDLVQKGPETAVRFVLYFPSVRHSHHYSACITSFRC